MPLALLDVVVALALLSFVMQIWALFHILSTPTSGWDQADQNQLVWVIVVVALPLVGVILFWIIAKPRLPLRTR